MPIIQPPTPLSLAVKGGPRKLRVAFLGGGIDSAVGQVHQIAIGMDQRFDLVAGCFSREMEINQSSGVAYGVDPDHVYPSLEDLIAAEAKSIDAFVVVTPTDQHLDHVLRCVTAGIPVICEKALALDDAEAMKIKEALDRHNGYLAVTYNYLGYPMLRELKDIIARGQLGAIHQVHVEMPQEGFSKVRIQDGNPIVPQDWRLHDGNVPTVSLDLGVHLHIITKFLTDAVPLETVATASSFGNFDNIVDNVIATVRYSGDMVTSIWYGKVALGCRNGLKVRVFGEAGAAEWCQEYPEDLLLSDRYGRRFRLDRGHPDVRVSNAARYTRFKAGHPTGFIEAFANLYVDIADHLLRFHESRQCGETEYVYGIDGAIEGLRLLSAIAHSAREKRWVRVS
jgi:predicted dehydrogenase